jgi:hypothetical protein
LPSTICCPKSATNKCLILEITVITTQSTKQIHDVKAVCSLKSDNKLNARNKIHEKYVVILSASVDKKNIYYHGSLQIKLGGNVASSE